MTFWIISISYSGSSSSSSSVSDLGAMSGTTKLASSNVTTITPQTRKRSRSRWGNTAPEATVKGMVEAMESDTAPLGPHKVVTRAFLIAGPPSFIRLPVSGLSESRSAQSIHRKRTPTITAVRMSTRLKIQKRSAEFSCRAGARVEESTMPRLTKMTPLSTKEKRCQTLSEAMLRRVENVEKLRERTVMRCGM